MGNTWFTSDTHFDHNFVARLRGYESAAAHDAAVINTWNRKVRPGDTVWHLGDVGMGRPDRWAHFVERLNGTVHLIAGNHDAVHPLHPGAPGKFRTWAGMFASIQTVATINLAGTQVLASHFPYAGEGARDMEDRYVQHRLRNLGAPLVHGHTHDADQRLTLAGGAPMVHVGWDAWRGPVLAHEVRQLLNAHHRTDPPR